MEHNGPPRNQLTGSLPPPDNGAPQQGSGRRVTLDSVRDLELFQYTQVKMRELLPDGVPPPYYTRTDLKPRLISAMKERVPTMPDDEATSLVERFMNFRFVTHNNYRFSARKAAFGKIGRRRRFGGAKRHLFEKLCAQIRFFSHKKLIKLILLSVAMG